MAGFAQMLRQQRLACGFTQEELAEHARVSVRAISDLERGINHAPRLSTVRLLVGALRLEPADAAVLLEAARSEPVEQDASQPVAFDVRYAKRVDGACTAYAILGRGPVLLIPPGFISHLEWWGSAPGVSAFLRPLARHRSVVLYDRHGCGLSDRDRTEFTAEDDMQDIEAVARAVGSPGVDLLGVSWGGGASNTVHRRPSSAGPSPRPVRRGLRLARRRSKFAAHRPALGSGGAAHSGP